jgi:hypothetical protein
VNKITAAYRLAWCNPKLERRTTPAAGDGLFAANAISKDELLVVWGGVIVTTEQLYKLPMMARHRAIQVEQDHHLSSGLIDDDADCVNHSCNPNSGMRGQIALVAMRDITLDEEIAFDYAMSDAHPLFVMECACETPNCRGKITGDDWKLTDLQKRYKGYFSPYIQRLIDAQTAG